MPQPFDRLRDIAEGASRMVASGIADVRKEWEIFAYGRQVTGRTTNITLGSLGEKSPSERESWFDRFFGREPQASEQGKDAREPSREPSREQSHDRDR